MQIIRHETNFLAFYGIIPEAVTQITAVQSLKTAVFKNDFGVYSYKKVREGLFFGYERKPMVDRSILFAFPEKALLDLLYLYPFYNTEAEIENLRLDNDYLANDLNKIRFDEYACRFESKALTQILNRPINAEKGLHDESIVGLLNVSTDNIRSSISKINWEIAGK